MSDEILDQPKVTDSNKYVGFGMRLLAYILDFAIFSTVSGLIFGDEVIKTNNGFQVSYNNEYMLIPLLYFFLTWGIMSSTPAKMMLGIKIINEEGKKINWSQAGLRIVGYLILFIGCWFILGNDKKQALHDKIAKTYVVKK